jgi:hypothetical protein
LHSWEEIRDARLQLELAGQLLTCHTLPADVSLLGGRLTRWLNDACGVKGPASAASASSSGEQHCDGLLPSVRFGLETAILDCLAQQRVGGGRMGRAGASENQPVFLLPPPYLANINPGDGSGDGDQLEAAGSAIGKLHVAVNGLVSEPEPEAAAAQAAHLVAAHGYTALKLKVARRSVGWGDTSHCLPCNPYVAHKIVSFVPVVCVQ